jgi:MFS transporter, DHA1 family, multidrug resistance protein B
LLLLHWKSWDLNLKVLLIGETLFNTFFWMYFPFITLYFSDTLGNVTAGILMTVPPLMSIVGSMLGGHLSDSLGRRKTMLFGTSLRIIMFALFAVSSSHWIDYLAFIGISLGGSIYSPASSTMVADLTPEENRRKIFAVFVTGINIGAVFGPAMGSFFFFHYRNELLWSCTMVTLLYFIAIFYIIRETLPKSVKNNRQSNTLILVLKEQWESYSVIFRDKAFALYILAGIFVMIAFRQLDLYLAVYISNYVPVQTLFAWGNRSFMLGGTELFGVMMGLNGLMFILCVLPITKWFQNWSDRNTFIFSSLTFGFGIFLVGLTTNVWLLLVFMAIFTVGEISRSPVAQSFVSKYAPEGARGRYMGASGLQNSIGRLIAPMTVVLSSWMTPIGIFGILLICTLISAFLYIRLFQIIPASFMEKKKVPTVK